jgi:excisionase family DNA binding protein
MDDKLMIVREVADYLGVPTATVYTWNSRGTGPKYRRIGRHVRWRRAEVDAWIDSHTSDEPSGTRVTA